MNAGIRLAKRSEAGRRNSAALDNADRDFAPPQADQVSISDRIR
jgi:hypothetical protein